MGLLAYHPDEVGRLHQAMRRALDDLHAVSCHDPAAADVMSLLRRSAAQLETVWLPLAFRLLTTDPLSGRQRRDAGLDTLDLSLITVMAEGYGWSVQTDPLADDTSVVTAEEARALGAMLNEIDPQALADDPAQLAWLAQQLAVIGTDPVLSREFLANFHNWDTLPLVLGTQRAALLSDGGDGGAAVRDIDGVFDGLTGIWRNALDPRTLAAGTQATVGSLLPDLHQPDPYVQALMLRSLHLDPMTLATVSHELLSVWIEHKYDGDMWSIDLAPRLGPNTADILLAEVALDPIACVRFLTLAQENLDVLFWTLEQPDIAHRIVLTATDPANVTARQAEPLVLAVIEYFRVDPYRTGFSTDGYPGEYGRLLGELVVPWLQQFTNTNDDWSDDNARHKRAIAIVMGNDEAMQTLLTATDRIVAGYSFDSDHLVQAQQIGSLLNMIYVAAIDAQVDDEANKSQAGWDLLWTVLSAATNFLDVHPLWAITIGLTVDQLGEFLGEQLLDQPDPERARQQGELLLDLTVTTVAAQWLNSLLAEWCADGTLPTGFPPPPQPDLDSGCISSDWHDELDDWLAGLPGGRSGLLATTAAGVVDAVVGNGQAEGQCTRLTS